MRHRFVQTLVGLSVLLVGCQAERITASPIVSAPAVSALPVAGTDTTLPPPTVSTATVRGAVHDFVAGMDTSRTGVIAGARVDVIRMDSQGVKMGVEATTVTDAFGAFEVANLPPRTFFLVFTAPGYRTSEYVISTRQPLLWFSAIMTRATP